MPEKRAGVGEDFVDAFIEKEMELIRVDGNFGLFPRVLVVHDKPEVPEVLFNRVNVPEVATAVTTLETLESRDLPPLPDALPDRKDEFKGDKDDNYQLEEVRVLDSDLIRQH